MKVLNFIREASLGLKGALDRGRAMDVCIRFDHFPYESDETEFTIGWENWGEADRLFDAFCAENGYENAVIRNFWVAEEYLVRPEDVGEVKPMPDDVSLTFLVTDDAEFLRHDVYECATAEEAIKKYRSVLSDGCNGIAAIGFKLHKDGDEEYVDTTHYFFTENEERPDFSEPFRGYEYEEVRAAVLDVFDFAMGSGLWKCEPQPTVKLWARIGMSLEVPKSTYEKLLQKSMDEQGRYHDCDLDGDLVADFLDYGILDGDSYVPASVFEEKGGDLL